MTGILEQADLDYLALQPCELPNCGERHPGWCWFYPDCHIGAAVFLTLETTSAVIRCGQCLLEIGHVYPERVRLRCEVHGAKWAPNGIVMRFFRAACHHNGWMVMSYSFGAGVLEVLCAVCHESLGRIGLPGH